MKATICDVCGKVIEEGSEPTDFTRTWPDGKVSISLSGDKDRCDGCIKKANARLLRLAWGCEKQVHKPKPTLKVAA